MRRIFCLIAAVILTLGAVHAHADQKVVVIESARIGPYEEALQGFRKAYAEMVPTRGLKSMRPGAITELAVGEQSADELRQRIVAERPDILLVIGQSALSAVSGLEAFPIVFLLVPEACPLPDQAQTTGVLMCMGPTAQFAAIKSALPDVRRLGVIYHPGRNKTMLEQAMAAAAGQDLTLVAEAADSPRAVSRLLAAMEGKIDGLWMVPDPTVITPQTVEAMLIYSLEKRVPVVTFSEKYMELGATVAITFDLFAMGEQAGEMVSTILAGTPVASIPKAEPRKFNVIVNGRVAKKLGIAIDRTKVTVWQ